MLSTPAKYLQKIDTMFGKSDEKPAASRVSERLEGLDEGSRQDSQDEGSQGEYGERRVCATRRRKIPSQIFSKEKTFCNSNSRRRKVPSQIFSKGKVRSSLKFADFQGRRSKII